MYAYTVHCIARADWLDRVLLGPNKFLRLISDELSNKVYNLNVYKLQDLYVTKFILNKVYT
jgi:hypothetical protein